MNKREEAFSEIEKRVALLLAQNARLKNRIDDLDKELLRIRNDAQQVEHLYGEKLHIKKKIERILQSLEDATGKD